MVSFTGTAMISDFGTSRMIGASYSPACPSSTPKGTYQYLAPELVSPDVAVHSKEADVWAFGMTIHVCNTQF